MTECATNVAYTFCDLYRLDVRFSGLDLSADAGVLLARQAEAKVKIGAGMAAAIAEWRDPLRLTHPLRHLISQRVYQLVCGYEDANDSDAMRHDPLFKIACDRVPQPGDE